MLLAEWGDHLTRCIIRNHCDFRSFFLLSNFYKSSPVIYLNKSLCRVSRVWPDDQTGFLVALHDSLLQFVSPDVFTGIKDVVAVADHWDGARGELLQHSLKRLLLLVPPPRDDGTGWQKGHNSTGQCHSNWHYEVATPRGELRGITKKSYPLWNHWLYVDTSYIEHN